MMARCEETLSRTPVGTALYDNDSDDDGLRNDDGDDDDVDDETAAFL